MEKIYWFICGLNSSSLAKIHELVEVKCLEILTAADKDLLMPSRQMSFIPKVSNLAR